MANLLPMGTKAIYFDAVGTVLFPHPTVAEIYATIAARWGITTDPATIQSQFRESFQREESIDRAHHWKTNEARELERWKRIVHEALPGATDGCFRDIYHHFAQPEAWRVPKEVEPLLTELRRRGYLLGLASNLDSRIDSILTGRPELQLLREHVIISSRIGVRKPGVEFFVKLAESAKCQLGEVVLIGDDLDNDFHGARQAGAHAILYDPKRRHPNLAPSISNWNELSWDQIAGSILDITPGKSS